MFEITVKSVWLTLPPSADNEHSFSSTLSVILSFAPRSTESYLLLVASSPRPCKPIRIKTPCVPTPCSFILSYFILFHSIFMIGKFYKLHKNLTYRPCRGSGNYTPSLYLVPISSRCLSQLLLSQV